jgi:ABC-2 type transport system permease protein
MVNILRHELRLSFRSWLYFTIGMLATFAIFAAFFSAFKSDTAVLYKLIQNFPPEFKAAFGFADVDLAEAIGYLSFIIGYIVLVGAVFGMKQGLSLLSEEVRVKTADFLLSKPVRRGQVVTAKLLAALVTIAAQNLIFYTLSLALIPALVKEPFDNMVFALLSFSIFFVQLFFVGIGMLIASALQKLKSVMPVTLGVVFFFFIVESINQSLLEKKLTYLTPFSYFKGSGILKSRSYDMTYLLVDLAVFLVSVLLSYWIYQKKDIHAV